MEPKRKKTVRISINGGRSFFLDLAVEPVLGDRVIPARLVAILMATLQGRPPLNAGIRWDAEKYREEDASVTRIYQTFAGVNAPTVSQRPHPRRILALMRRSERVAARVVTAFETKSSSRVGA